MKPSMRNLMKLGLQHTKPLTKTIILCILETVLQQNKGRNLELLELVYISFQTQECRSPLPAYCTLKIFQQKEENHSFYFKCIKESMNEQLKEAIIEKQQLRKIANSQDYLEKELNTTDIRNGQKYEEKYLPKIKFITEMKITYWQKLLQGFNQLSEFQKEVIKLSKASLALENELEVDMKFDSREKFYASHYQNIIILKLFSLYFGVILNDFDYSFRCELQIEEILKIERSLSSDLILNQSVFNDKVILMTISTIKNRGTISFEDKKKLVSFFGFQSLLDFSQINHINQLMPQFVADKHDKILERYLQLGTSDRFTSPRLIFILNKKGFVFPVHIKLENFFEQKDDYVLTASFNKVRESSDFLLFNEQGKIVALTENVFKLLFPLSLNIQKDQEELLEFGYIFFIFPQIFNILQKDRENLSSAEYDSIFLEQKSSINISNNLFQMMRSFCQFKEIEENYEILQKQTKKLRRADEEMLNFNYENHIITSDQQLVSENYNDSTHMLGCHILLLEKDYQDIIFDFMALPENSVNKFTINEYLIKFNLKFKVMGNGDNSQPYFYMEINDFRKREEIKTYFTDQFNYLKETNRSTDSRFSQPSKQFIYLYLENISLVTPMNQSYSITIDHQYYEDKQPVCNNIIKQDNSGIQEENMDSARASMSIGPLSQRARFVNPGQVSFVEDFKEIEKDLKELLNNQNISYPQTSSRFRRDNQKLQLINENDEDFDFNEFQLKDKSSSQKQQDSQNIKKILKEHRFFANGIEDLEKPTSTYSGKSSNRECLQIINNIKHKQNLNKYLKVILLILISLVVIYSASNLTNIIIQNSVIFIESDEVDNIFAPFKFGEYYYKIFVGSWINLLNQLNILHLSEFLQKQIDESNKQIRQTAFIEMEEFYHIFIRSENQNFFQKFTIKQVLSEDLNNQKFSQFYFSIREKFEQILRVNTSEDKNYLEDNVLYDILFLKFNLETFIVLNKQLIKSLAQLIWTVFTDLQQTDNLILIFELIILFIVILIPLYFNYRLIQYERNVLILITRVNQKLAQQMIMRYMILKDVLDNRWKKTDFSLLLFRKWEQVNLGQYQTDLKILKLAVNQFAEQEQKNSSSTNQRKNLTLTQKIKDTSLPIYKEIGLILFIYLIISTQLLGGTFLSKTQQNFIQSTITLTVDFIDYTFTYNTFITCGIIIKTQQLVIPKIKDFEIFDINQKVTSTKFILNQSDSIIDIFAENYLQITDKFFKIFVDITENLSIQSDHKQQLINLFSDSFCLYSNEKFPFCEIKLDNEEQFIKIYGKPDINDNNLEYLEKGIVGLNAQTIQIIHQNFYEELSFRKLELNEETLSFFLQSKDFNNDFIQNFLDYDKVFEEFVNILIDANDTILVNDYKNLLNYYLITFLFIMINLLLGIYFWIDQRSKRIQNIRLGICNIPYELLLDQQIIQMLKKLSQQNN